MTANILPEKIETRNTAWFNQYTIKISFELVQAQLVRCQSHRDIDRRVRLQREWANALATTEHNSWSWAVGYYNTSDQDIAAIHKLHDFMKKHKDYRAVTEYNQISFYTNSEKFVDKLLKLKFLKLKNITRITVIGQPNTIRRKNSKFQYRSYFCHCECTPTEINSINHYLLAQEDIKVSPGLEWSLSRSKIHAHKNKVLCSHYFFDHITLGTAQIMNLLKPGIIRKTVTIISDK